MPATSVAWQDDEVGEDPVSDNRLPTGRLVQPAGQSLELYGRPVDLTLSQDGQYLYVKDWRSIRVVDPSSMKLLQTVPLPGNASLFGLTVGPSGRLYCTSAGRNLHVFKAGDSEPLQPDRSIELPDGCFPVGVAVNKDETFALVCLSKRNSLAVVDIESNEVLTEIEVGVAPFDVQISDDGKKWFVSNIGGRRPLDGDQTAPSAGTETIVDQRGIASTGTVSVIDSHSKQIVRTDNVGLHPSDMLRWESTLYVCNTNMDSLTVIDTRTGRLQTIQAKPDANLPFGSMPAAVEISPDGKWLFVAMAGNNAIAVMDRQVTPPTLVGLVPAAWYPASLECDDQHLFVANIKGVGARTERRDSEKGRNSHDHRGTVQRVKLSEIGDQQRLKEWTESVRKNARIPQIIRTLEPRRSSKPAVKPVPVPQELGQPSVFKHVIYVIKENRTFDQVFGDISEARSESSLCVFPENVTPNHHALARRFGILDNYYCNGVLSADGHSWATEGNVTPYLERAFGGFARSYTFGDDPITYSSSGFLWDHVLAAGLSFRNYGEMDYATPPDGMKYKEIWKAYQDGHPIEFEQKIGIERLRRYSCRDYPGWNMVIPDVLRISRFLKEFDKFDQEGGLPNLSIVYLPQDHLGGGVTSRAHMADNDLALGQLVDAVSRSRYWKETVIFVNEDDPQNGFDHIDGHRSICFAISPYSRPGVNHGFFNQTSVLRTILHIFGIPPMNQQDASAPLMTSCFSDTVVDPDPYDVIPANFPLDELPKPTDQQSAEERRWRAILATVPIKRTGMKSPQDEDNLNRFLWHEQMGWTTRYPQEWAGPHATGLRDLGLLIDEDSKD